MKDAAHAAAGPRPWRPAPAILASMLLHAAAAVTLVASPRLWPWILAAVAANHLLLFAAVFWPRGRLLGENVVRLPAAAAARNEVCLTFDDGPDPKVTPQVLDLLDRYRMRATFFCVGEKVAAHPQLAREIVRRGHSLENHSQRHSWMFACYGPGGLLRDVGAAQAAIAGAGGRAPAYFRAPMGLRSPLLDPVLARLGLTYVSWTRRGYDATARDPDAVLRRLAGGLAAGDILLLHDDSNTRAADGVPIVLAVLPRLLEQMKSRGLSSVTLRSALEDGPTG
jgi:peptidoglycan/xylan/chitin deacetylase (PgdA/CDA1 family)